MADLKHNALEEAPGKNIAAYEVHAKAKAAISAFNEAATSILEAVRLPAGGCLFCGSEDAVKLPDGVVAVCATCWKVDTWPNFPDLTI